MRLTHSSAAILKLAILVLVSFSVVRAADEPELLIPASTKISLQLLSPVSTSTSKKGDKYSCKILTPAEFAGAIVEGHVRSVKRSGKANKESKIDLAFDRITLADGRVANFSATVLEVFEVANAKDQGRADNEGTLRNKSTAIKTSIKRAAVGALIGAVVGGVIAGGQGAAVGAAIGASVGATTTLATKGPDLEFNTGTEFTVQTDGPTRTVSRRSVGGPAAWGRVEAPAAPTRVHTTQAVSVTVPENWIELAPNPTTLGPSGAYRLNNGQPELSHGVVVGVAPATGSLQEVSNRLVGALTGGKTPLRKLGELTPAMIGSVSGFSVLLAGVNGAGKPEMVTVHTALLPGNRFFFVISVAPQEEQEIYNAVFSRVIASIQVVQ
jgi:outer membrane lipoprotein SlyB